MDPDDKFCPTPPDFIQEMLRLGGVGKGTSFIDLGSGDGRVVGAALALGADAYGCERDQELFYKSSQIYPGRIILGDALTLDLTPYDIIAVYLSNGSLEAILSNTPPGKTVIDYKVEIRVIKT